MAENVAPIFSDVSPQGSLGPGPVARPSEVGQDIQGAAGSIEKVTQLAAQSKERDAWLWQMNASSQMRQNLYEGLAALKENYNPKDDNFTDQASKMFEDETKDLANDAPTFQSKKQIEMQMRSMQGYVLRNAIRYHTQTRINYGVDQVKQTVDANSASIQSDPSQFENIIGHDMTALEGLHLGPMQQKAEELMRKNYAEAYVIGSMNQPGQAVQTLNHLQDPGNAPLPYKLLDPMQLLNLRNKARTTAGYEIGGQVENALKSGGLQSGLKAWNGIENRTDLDPQMREAAESKARQSIELWHFQKREMLAPQIANMVMQLKDKNVGPDFDRQLMGLFNQGGITTGELAGYSGQAEAIRERMGTARAASDAVAASLASGEPLTKHQNDQAKWPLIQQGVDDVIEKTGAKIGDQTGNATIAAIDARLGVMTDSQKGWLAGNMLYTNPKNVEQALDLYGRLRDSGGDGLISQLPDHVKAYGEKMYEMVKSGTPITNAIEDMQKLKNMTHTEETYYADKYKERKLPLRNESYLRDAISREPQYQAWNKNDKDVPPSMSAEFSDLRHKYYVMTGGDEEVSAKLAFADIKNKYRVSDLNGQGKILAWAPTDFNSREALVSMLKESPDLVNTHVKDHNTGAPEPLKQSDADTMELLPVSETLRTRGRVWGLTRRGDYGDPQMVFNSANQPQLIQLPEQGQYSQVFKQLDMQNKERERAARDQRRAELAHLRDIYGTNLLSAMPEAMH